MKDELVEEGKNVIAVVAKALVDKSERIKVTAHAAEHTVIFTIDCDEGDLGKLIGRKGRIADSIRNIMASVAAKHGCRCIVELPQ